MSAYFVTLIHVMLLFLFPYCVFRIVWNRHRDSKGTPAREIAMAVFLLFMLGLLTLTFNNGSPWLRCRTIEEGIRRIQERRGVNLVPFHTIRNYLRHASNVEMLMVNLVGNIAMFLPWGFGLPLLWKKFQSAKAVTLMSLLLPVLIETTQLFLGRTVDIDDVILNFCGGLIGGLLYGCLYKTVPLIRTLGGE